VTKVNIDKSCTACFSGYRPKKFSFPLDMDSPEFEPLQDNIEATIKNAAQNGYTTFLCGMAAGFDLICADVFYDVRESGAEFEHLKLAAIIPFQGHKVPEDWRTLYVRTISRADHVEILLPTYQSGCYLRRNDWLIEHSSRLICYWDGQEGGTAYTVRMADSAGMTIDNIAKAHN